MDALRLARQRYEAGGDAVLLIAIHQVKGREWPLVIVTGLEDGQFPSPRANPEEERRLAYVAMTRAQEQLMLVGAARCALRCGLGGQPVRGPAVSRTPASRFAFEAKLRTGTALGGDHRPAVRRRPRRRAAGRAARRRPC